MEEAVETVHRHRADVTGLTSHTKVTLSANGNNLYLFYDKNDNKIYDRMYDGAASELREGKTRQP
jgi:hypothetical protein